jgi:hypothetical protein
MYTTPEPTAWFVPLRCFVKPFGPSGSPSFHRTTPDIARIFVSACSPGMQAVANAPWRRSLAMRPVLDHPHPGSP